MLLSYFQDQFIEVGCDEAGRGCLAGPVFAAAVIFDKNFTHAELNDSKQLTLSKRQDLRKMIEDSALDFAVASLPPAEIDRINIHQASYKAMHMAIDLLKIKPEFILVDGNKFIPYPFIQHQCIVKGDAKYLSIAAASVLAKTYRDDFMLQLHEEFPQYNWAQNKGYPTIDHRHAIIQHGASPYHRTSFRVTVPRQMAKAAPNTKIIDEISAMDSPT